LTANQNALIERLPRRERTRLLASCEQVELNLSEVLCEAGTPTRHVYFPTEGFISLVASIDKHPSLEIGMVGREGMLGAQMVLGVTTSPLRGLVQGAGLSWRVEVPAFQAALADSPALLREMNRYVYVLMAQTVQSAGCLRFHQIAHRLARWLLMSQDRAHDARFHVTHEFLAYMMGVRRVGVTVAAGELQRRGLIKYKRGEVTVLDRPGLEGAACGCYAADRAIYAQQLG
jgi:CRP-like cAMP-binding protein